MYAHVNKRIKTVKKNLKKTKKKSQNRGNLTNSCLVMWRET
jgi:hypothetical protein